MASTPSERAQRDGMTNANGCILLSSGFQRSRHVAEAKDMVTAERKSIYYINYIIQYYDVITCDRYDSATDRYYQ